MSFAVEMRRSCKSALTVDWVISARAVHTPLVWVLSAEVCHVLPATCGMFRQYIYTCLYCIQRHTILVLFPLYNIRAVAPSPAGPAMAGPVFAAGTKTLNIEDMHFKHTFKLGGVLA